MKLSPKKEPKNGQKEPLFSSPPEKFFENFQKFLKFSKLKNFKIFNFENFESSISKLKMARPVLAGWPFYPGSPQFLAIFENGPKTRLKKN